MSALPDGARRVCPAQCGVDVAYALTPRKSKGRPVEILIDFHPEQGTGGTVPVQVQGDVVYGDTVPKHLAESMRAAGRDLHALHKETCIKRNSSRKT